MFKLNLDGVTGHIVGSCWLSGGLDKDGNPCEYLTIVLPGGMTLNISLDDLSVKVYNERK